MTDLNDLPSPREEPPAQRRSALRNLSLIWLAPLVALVVVVWIAWENYSNRGTLIEITFQNASGISAGETTLQYRDVVVGTVEDVSFSEGLRDVRISVRVDNEILPYLDEDAQFWVVRPEVSAQGISGLSTVLSGAHIAAAWDLEAGEARTAFEGLPRAPLAQPGLDGVRIVLRTDDGTTVASGAPVLFRGVQVGQLEQPRLTEAGDSILVEAFIEAPHDQLVTSATRFWDTSGFNVSLGTAGLSLEVDSIASLVSGGVSFDRVFEAGAPVEPGQVFELFVNEAEARRRPFLAPGEATVDFVVRFGDTAAGLSPGAPVTYRGLQVGQVSALRTELVRGGDGIELGLTTTVQLDPQLMGLGSEAETETSRTGQMRALLAELVEGGLRAQLVSQGLLGGSLAVALVDAPEAAPAALVVPESGPPEIPSIPQEASDFAASAQGLMDSVAALPLEATLDQAIGLMASIEALARQESTRDLPRSVVALLDETRALVASEDIQALPGDLRASVTALQGFITELEAAGTIEGLTSALDAARIAAEDVSFAIVGVPDLIAELDAVAEAAGELPLAELVARAESVLASAEALIASDDAQALPPALIAAVEEIEAVLASANALLAAEETQALPGAVAAAVEDVRAVLASADALLASEEVQDLPGLVTTTLREAETTLASANALIASDGVRALPQDLSETLAQAESVLANANALLAAPDTQAAPAALTRALGEVETVLGAANRLLDSPETEALPGALAATLREAETALANANSVIASEGIQTLPESLGETLARADAVLDNANALIGSADVQAVPGAVTRALAEVETVLGSANALIASEDTQDLPVALTGALREVEAALAELRAGGTVENLNATLASASDAADAIARAADDLPELTRRLNLLVAQGEALARSYGDESAFNATTLRALRELTDAARAVTRLAREIERNPNSLLFGR